MAKRRRVGNLLALAVLAALAGKSMHPYEIASVLRETGKEHDMRFKWGSLYTVVQNLERHGLIEATESVRQGGRPERTVYRITDAGRDELMDWVRELVRTPERETPKFKAALSVLGVIPPDEAIGLLRERLEQMTTEIEELRGQLAQWLTDVPRMFLVEAEYELAMRSAEAAWVAALLDELSSGEFPDLAQWRAWHETGQVPQPTTSAEGSGT
jgi:DNA-binding PadR family transcriptional regulator